MCNTICTSLTSDSTEVKAVSSFRRYRESTASLVQFPSAAGFSSSLSPSIPSSPLTRRWCWLAHISGERTRGLDPQQLDHFETASGWQCMAARMFICWSVAQEFWGTEAPSDGVQGPSLGLGTNSLRSWNSLLSLFADFDCKFETVGLTDTVLFHGGGRWATFCDRSATKPPLPRYED